MAVGRTHGNGMGATRAVDSQLSRGVANEFDRSMNKASYVDDTPVPVIVMDCEHNIEYVNSAAALLAGRASEGCVGLKFWDLFDNEACHNGTCLAADAIREGRTVSGAAECIVQGRTMLVRATVSPRFDEHHKVIGVVQVIEDNSQEKMLVDELARVAKAARGGHFKERGKPEQFQGSAQNVIREVNDMLDANIDKLNWFQSVLDAVPLPVHVMDKHMNWVFMNLAFEKLMKEASVITERHESVGKPCSLSGKSSCKTSNCGVVQLTKGVAESFFNWKGESCKQNTTKLFNAKKEHIGYVEIAQDLTPIVRPKEYTSCEVDRLAGNLKKLAEGNFELDLQVKEADQYTAEEREHFNRINQILATVKSAVKSMSGDAAMLCSSAIEGNFDIRADATRHSGDYREIVQSVNQTLDVVVDKLSWYQSIIDAVQLPIHVIDKDMKWVFLNRAFEKLMVGNGIIRSRKDAPGMPCSSANANICKTENCGLAQLAKGVGETYFDWHGQNCRQESSKLVNIKGEHVGYVEVVQDLTSMVRNKNYTANEVTRVAANLEKLAQGNFDIDLQLKESDQYTAETKQQFDRINEDLKAVKSAVEAMTLDADMLTKAAVEGKLEVRADASKHHGNFRKIVEGVNQTLDAVIGPLNVAAGYVDRISKGDIPEKITDNYNGDFNTIKINLNECIDALSGLIQQMNHMSTQHDLGDIDIVIPADNFQGAYRTMAEGLNNMVMGHISVKKKAMACLKQFGEGNFEAELEKFPGKKAFINDTIEHVRKNLKALIADADTLVQAAVQGKLSTRADASKHQGDFRKIVEGVNSTLDAVVGPMQDVSAILTKLAGGDFTATVTGKYVGDYELLTDAVNLLSTTVRMALEEIGRNVSSLASSAEELNKVSQSLGSNADETATQANVVSAAAEQVSNNVQTVATGADEMGASIKEIAKSTAEASRVATSAVRTAEVTNVTISKLGQSSAEIGQVIKVITSIAQQTNLLALNATIEAARAGEAGKGFAVVANEVKELAKETARATEDISRKIEAIQSDTNGAVSAISQISQVIGQISDIQTTIASAIEEQSATTNEIGRTLAEAAKGSTDISKNIGGVAEAAHATTVGATDTSKSAHSLEKMAAELQTLVSQFRY